MADPYAAFSSPVSKGKDDPYAAFSSPVKAEKPRSARGAAVDGAMGAVQGVRESLTGMADTAMRAAIPVLPKTGSPTNALAEFSGRVIGAASNFLRPGTGSATQEATQNYQPQTEVGKVARTVGQNLPNAFAPGSGLQRVANVVVPAIGTELAKRGVKAIGGSEQQQELAGQLGGMAGAVAANARVRSNTAPKPVAPTKAPDLETLQGQKNAAYKVVDDAGVQYRPEAVSRLASDLRVKMTGEEIDPDLHPKATAVLKRIETLKDQPQTLTRLEKIRRLINDNVLSSPSKDERRLGHMMRDELDGFVEKSAPEDVMSNGDASVAAQSLKSARELNTRVSKMESIDRAITKARDRTSQSGSGGNIDNNIRSELRKVRDRGRGWTPEEKAALDKAIKGGPVQNVLRTIGKASPVGNGLMQFGNVAAAVMSGGKTAVVSGGAMAAKYVADGMTKAKADRIVEMMAQGKEGQARQLAYNDAKAARLIGELKRLHFGSSTAKELSAGSPGRQPSPPSGQRSTRPARP